MDIDVASVDEALRTTRVVRRRLDLDRLVDEQILLDCIDIAEQAPTGGNQSSRRWIIVRDQRLKDRLAELYMEAAGQWMIASADKLDGTGHAQEQIMKSAAYLANHLAEVPAIVIPTIIGVHDGSGRPGLFDSIIQSVWSFSVALRARGLGSAWTTANLSRQDDIAELLGIPDGMTQIAMIPVGWTKGTGFRLAPRYPAREITYFDGFARTWESGPSDPPKHSDGPGAIVEVDIKATSPSQRLALGSLGRTRIRTSATGNSTASSTGARSTRNSDGLHQTLTIQALAGASNRSALLVQPGSGSLLSLAPDRRA